MSAMPAWAKTLDDDAIWDVVAFVRKMPGMGPADYRQLVQR
jgi:mono/diheme cytochrome c family protein